MQLRQILPVVAIDISPRVAVVVARGRANMVAGPAADDKQIAEVERTCCPASKF